MRIAVFSDIHGNYELLDKTLLDISDRNVDKIICLGDIIGKGPDSLKCIRRIYSSNILTIQGNWEMYINRGFENYDEIINHHAFYEKFLRDLTGEELQWINSLPFEYSIKCDDIRFLFMHFPIEDINRQYPFYFLSTLRNGTIFDVLKNYNYDVMVFGHAHEKRVKDNVIIVPSTLSDEFSYLVIDVNGKEIKYEWSDIPNE